MAALDATVGGASANSYLAVDDADAYAADDLGPEASRWSAATTTVAEREVALKRATREVDRYVRPGFGRYSPTQRLRFPRSVDVDSSGDPYIPTDILEATYYQAAFVLVNAAVIDRASARHARNADQTSEPGVSYTPGDDPSSTMSPRALQALADYAKASSRVGGSMRSARVASGFAD